MKSLQKSCQKEEKMNVMRFFGALNYYFCIQNVKERFIK